MTEAALKYKLDCYKKIEVLNEKGNLWLVKDSVSGKLFILRRLSMEHKNVYQALSSLRHPHIVEILDVFSYQDALYVIEEYLPGSTLSDFLKEKGPMGRQASAIGKQLLDALVFLHENHIIHRDIKPENIIINGSSSIKLIDFDIARQFSEEKKEDTTVKGSRIYAPPEQYGFAQSDFRTDIYSFGITLNEIATGYFPEEHLSNGILRKIVRNCTEFDPKRRYQTAGQVLAHLKRLERTNFIWKLSAVILPVFLLIGSLTIKKPASSTADSSPAAENLPADAPVSEPEPAEYVPEDELYSFPNPIELASMVLRDSDSASFSYDLDLQGGFPVSVDARKKKDCLNFSCSSEYQKDARFSFEDFYLGEYKETYDSDHDPAEYSPVYEIVLTDINGDGMDEFLVTFARAKRIEARIPYDLIDYTLTWVIYLTEDKTFACSEPLIIKGSAPALLFNDFLHAAGDNYYTFKNGEWELQLY